MKVAALDLGSNTFLCLVCKIENNVVTQIYQDEAEVVRLGQGLADSKSFHPDALARAKKCLEKFKKIIELHKPERILAMATAAARDAENKHELLQICKNLEIPIEIIPGELEAQITYEGATSGIRGSENQIILDIGGRSTEFIFGSGAKIKNAQSLGLGCVGLTEKFILNQPTSNSEVATCVQEIQNKFIELQGFSNLNLQNMLAVAGTPTTLAAFDIGEFSIEKIDGYKLSLNQLQKWAIEFQQMSVEEKIKVGLPAGRADVILVGVLILIETLRFFKMTELVVSTRGVRYGVALEVARRN